MTDSLPETTYGHSYDSALQVQEWNDLFSIKADSEELPSPANTLRQIDIRGIYGSHTENDILKLANFRNQVKEALDMKKGNILVSLESGDLPDTASDEIYKLVKEGIKPSDAMRQVLAQGSTLVGREKSSPSAATQKAEQGTSNYLKEQIKILDSLWDNPDYKKRIRVLWEGRPKEVLDRERDEDPILKFKITDFSNPQKLHEITLDFKRVIKQQAESVLSRDTTTIRRITDRLGDRDDKIDAVVVTFGTRHSFLSRGLKTAIGSNLDTKTITVFNDKEGERIRFHPYDQLLTRVLHEARKDGNTLDKAVTSITNLIWEQSLVGEILLNSALRQIDGPANAREVQLRIERAMKEFETTEELETFLQKGGFIQLRQEVTRTNTPGGLQIAA